MKAVLSCPDPDQLVRVNRSETLGHLLRPHGCRKSQDGTGE
jgi:hypothetical protein